MSPTHSVQEPELKMQQSLASSEMDTANALMALLYHPQAAQPRGEEARPNTSGNMRYSDALCPDALCLELHQFLDVPGNTYKKASEHFQISEKSHLQLEE